MGTGAHHLQEDLSKGVLRTIHNVENGTLHFITIPPASSSREQEYIESSLLGADLLSNHLPNGLLVDYISNPGQSTPNNQYHTQANNLMDHHNSIQTYTAEDLQTLVDASTLQTSESDRKLFLQFVNKPNTQISHEAPVIVTNPKDMPSVNTLSDHDKLTQSQLTSVNHMPVATSGSNFIHYHHQDQLLNTTHSNMANLNNSGSLLTTHHGTLNHHHHHHHPHPHHHHHSHHHAPVTVSHQIIQNTTLLQQQSQSQPQQLQPQQQQPNQLHLSSIHPMLQSECVPPKLFHVASSANTSTNIAISTATSQNCIQMPPLAPIKRVESPKRYLAYQMAPPQQTTALERPPSDTVSTEGFNSREDMMDCEPRTDDEDEMETVHTTSSHFTNTYLPHKKRLAKKLVVSKSTNHADQFHRDSVISNDHQSHQNTAAEKPKAFACQLCNESFGDQLIFFTHLKGHYEPLMGSPIDDGKGNDPKKKPKLPRVKHTKKLQNDKSSRTTAEELAQTTTYKPNQQTVFSSQLVTHNENDRVYLEQNQLNTDVIANSQQHTALPVCTDVETAGEFSETEDMLEGIRNVVQKVQEAVDTDTNDGLGLDSICRTTVDDKAWFQAQQQQQQQIQTAGQSEMVKTIDFASDLDAQEIHINTGNDNFVLFLNKSDFQEQDLLEQTTHQMTTTQQPSTNRPNSNPQQHAILRHQLHPNHDPSTSFILETGQSLQQPTIVDECDMNSIQILGLSTNDIENQEIAKLVEFNLTAPHLNELDGAKLLKDERKSNEEPSTEDDNEECYVSDDEECEGDTIDTNDDEDHTEVVDECHQYREPDHENRSKSVVTLSIPAGRKKGRKKTNGETSNEIGSDDGSKKAGKKYPCAEPDCDKVFNSKTAVRYHELQHKNERPYNCNQCPKNFFTSSALKVHERLHSGEKPYKCEECGRAFRQWGDMKYHQSSIHSNEKTHQCEFCGKKFARRYSLVLHRKIHLNEKNHVCDICHKAFRASSYLQSHRMIHTGEKPYSCNICMKKFRCGGDMKRHLKTHDRSKPSSGNHKTTVQLEDESFDKEKLKTSTAANTPATDVIDLTKIKSEGGSKASNIQTPPVVTVLSKDISQAAGGPGSRISSNTSTGQLIYLTQAAGDQFRKPDETVLITEVARW